MNHDHLDALIDAHLSGVLSPEQHSELESRLLHSAADRARFWLLAETHSLLHQAAQQNLGTAEPARKPRRAGYWLSWRSLAAAAAGIVFGMLFTSVVFAYVAPKSAVAEAKAFVVADADFETGSPPPAQGIPRVAW
jgi:anti-sigma factor RsiW